MTAIDLPPHTAASSKPSDEIDLLDLFRKLWEQRLLIALVTAAGVCLAALYAFLATPVYQIQSVLRPPLIKDLDELNRTDVYPLSTSEALQRLGSALDSYENRLSFFRANPGLFAPLHLDGITIEQTFEAFNERAFKMLVPDAKKTDESRPSYVGLQLDYPATLDGVSILNTFVDYAIQQEREKLEEDVRIIIANRLRNLELSITSSRANYDASKEARIIQLDEADKLKRALLQDELNALRRQLKTQRENRIAQLGEAIQIAEALGIRKPTTPSALGQDQRPTQGNMVRTEVNNQQIPLYFMGTEALQAERSALSQRKSDDFTEPRIGEILKELQLLETNRQIQVLQQRENEDLFLTDLAKLREEQSRLRNLKVDFDSLQLVTIDQRAIEPSKPIKPKKTLILALGLVLGGMLGVFIALVRGMLRGAAAKQPRLPASV